MTIAALKALCSRIPWALILDPLAGHAPAGTHIGDRDLRGTIKEVAQLDGAFVISDAAQRWERRHLS